MIAAALAATVLALVPLGAQDDGSVMAGGPRLQTVVQRARSIHARAFRVIVRGNRGLDAYEPGLRSLCQAGFRVQVTLTDYRDEAFVRDALIRLGPCVAAWSFWNEPDLNIGLGRYRLLHLEGARLAREIDPSARVLIAETSPYTSVAELQSLDKLPGDGLAIHPYQRSDPRAWDPRYPTGIGAVPYLRALVKHPIYITEFGYWRGQQRWLRKALALARGARVRELVLYHLWLEPDAGRGWDTSLFDQWGRARQGARILQSEQARRLRGRPLTT